MTYKLCYGTDTDSLEDPYQIVLLSLPDECSDLDSDALLDYINEHGINEDGKTRGDIPATALVGYADVVESLRLALSGAGIDEATAHGIVTTLDDAIANSYYK